MSRVLISAYACEPNRGSEGEIGWSLVHEIALSNEVWVITRANNKEAHEAAFALAPKPATLNFLYYDLPKWARWYKKGKRLFLVYYYLWQLGSSREARRFLETQKVDVAHHLTGGMDWMPSGLARLGLPFVWGPVGSERTHPSIARALPGRVRIRERLRLTVHGMFRKMDPFVRNTGRCADVILSHTSEYLPMRYGSKIIPYIQTGINPSHRFALMKRNLRRGEVFTVVYAGELVHWKGAAYALQAFSRFFQNKPDVRLLVIGNGPLHADMADFISGQGLTGIVELLGRLPMVELIRTLADADVFLYPSYHHGLATVVLQAMLTGLPVVCLEGDAIGRAVGSECGITVPLGNSHDFIGGLASALDRLYSDEGTRVRLAKQAQQCAIEKYSYARIGQGYAAIYEVARDRWAAK